jgi:flagellar biosynthesis component FlhA
MENTPVNPNNRESIIPTAILPAIDAVHRLLSGEHVSINDLPAIKADFTEAIENGTASCGTAGQNLAPWTKEARKRMQKAIARFLLERDKDNKRE